MSAGHVTDVTIKLVQIWEGEFLVRRHDRAYNKNINNIEYIVLHTTAAMPTSRQIPLEAREGHENGISLTEHPKRKEPLEMIIYQNNHYP